MYGRMGGKPPSHPSSLAKKGRSPNFWETPVAPATHISKLEQRMQQKVNIEKERRRIQDHDDFDEMQSEDEFDDREVGTISPGAENSNDDGQPTSSAFSRGFSSERNEWKPASVMANQCYDSNGRLLCKSQCMDNLKKLMKKKKIIDFYDVLKSGNTPEMRAVAFCCFMLNQGNAKTPSSTACPKCMPNSVFDIDAAKSVDAEEELPGGKKIHLSEHIQLHMCSNWMGRNCVSNAVVSVLKEIYIRDQFFIIYASPESGRATKYPSLSGSFFARFAEILKSGFKISGGVDSSITLVSLIRKTVRNFIDKVRRQESPEKISQLSKLFATGIARDENFRSDEMPVHLCPILRVHKTVIDSEQIGEDDDEDHRTTESVADASPFKARDHGMIEVEKSIDPKKQEAPAAYDGSGSGRQNRTRNAASTRVKPDIEEEAIKRSRRSKRI